MAELDLPGVVMNQEYRVKLGKSFTFPKENAFHTIKYDFKPLSVDNSKPGKLRVGEGDEVNMSLPVVQAESADDVSQFRGPKRPCTRECVLIINTETGEAILEKIGSSVNLKSVRDGRPKARDRSISPAPFASKNQAMGKMAQTGKTPAPTAAPSHHKHSKKISKPPAKSRPKKLSEPASVASGGTSMKQIGGSMEVSKPKKKQSKYPSPAAHSADVQQPSTLLYLPKTSGTVPGPPVQPTNEFNPFNQGGNNPTDAASQKKETLEDSSGSSSGSGSSSSSGSSDSESEDESPVQQPSFAFPNPGGVAGVNLGGGAGVNPGGVAGVNLGGVAGVNPPASSAGVGVMNMPMNMPTMQPPQLPNRVPPSMPIFGAGSGTSGGVPVSIPPFPVQPVQNRASTSSSGSDSESSSDSSSGSSSDSSDTEDGKNQGGPTTAVLGQQPSSNLIKSLSTGEHDLSCSSSDSD